ncbi:MAG: hypothetical protein JO187_09905 [Acidobacteria bacterium]|nr:hypothetical protein [Acidobacteriota bacterium]
MARMVGVFTLAVAACVLFTATGATAQQPRIVVMVYNRAHAPAGEVAEAQVVAQKALRQAGVESSWFNCLEANPAPPCSEKTGEGRVVLSLVPRWGGGGETDDRSLGLALPIENGIGAYCYVFTERFQELVESAHTRPSGLLGLAMAHEICHLLKGTNSHSPSGIMAAWWYPGAIQSAGIGFLSFTEADRRTMQKRLLQYGRVK